MQVDCNFFGYNETKMNSCIIVINVITVDGDKNADFALYFTDKIVSSIYNIKMHFKHNLPCLNDLKCF